MKLSNASKQLLLSRVKDEITDLEIYLAHVNEQKKYYYQHADADNPESTQFYFDELNRNRDESRLAKKKIKQLARTSKELKSELRAGFLDKAK
jgi:hypothetical protein